MDVEALYVTRWMLLAHDVISFFPFFFLKKKIYYFFERQSHRKAEAERERERISFPLELNKQPVGIVTALGVSVRKHSGVSGVHVNRSRKIKKIGSIGVNDL